MYGVWEEIEFFIPHAPFKSVREVVENTLKNNQDWYKLIKFMLFLNYLALFLHFINSFLLYYNIYYNIYIYIYIYILGVI